MKVKSNKLVKKAQLRKIEESLMIDTVLQEKGRDSLDKMNHNVTQMNESLKKSNDNTRELLKMLRENRSGADNNVEMLQKIETIEGVSFKRESLEQVTIIDTPEIYLNWNEQVKENEDFAKRNNIDLTQPFINTFSNVERVNLYKELTDKFDIVKLDKYDYLFATSAGVVAGFIDAALVGTITNNTTQSAIPKMMDKQFDKIVNWYAKQEKIGMLEKQVEAAKSNSAKENLINRINALKNNKKIGRAGQISEWTKKDSINVLEKIHRVSYDAAINKGVKGMSPDNHHLLSLAHEPSLFGLLIGIIDQLTGKSTFIDTLGNVIRTSTGNLNNDLTGNMVQKISQATENWFGHIMSDIVGSSSSVGRGSGLPVPGWSSLQKIQVGNLTINDKNMNIAQVSDWMFKNGYDVRAFSAQLIPVIIYETLVRCYWFFKQKFYFGKSVKESFPVANNRELSRLLLFSAASFTAMDVGDATIKSINPVGFNWGQFLMTINVPGIIDLGFRCVQNIKNEMCHRNKVEAVVQNDVLREYNRILSEVY